MHVTPANTQTIMQSRFQQQYKQGLNRRFIGRLLGRSQQLFSFAEVEAQLMVTGQSKASKQRVPLTQIRGSVGRCRDFDSRFRPLRSHSRARWTGIAMRQHESRSLPPVDLVKVQDVYFVTDGHHRISVSNALGQSEIEANVVELQTEKSIKWEMGSQPHPLANVAGQARQIGCTLGAMVQRALTQPLLRSGGVPSTAQ